MKVTWELADGTEIAADVTEGTTLKDAALAAGVPGILGDCGGNLSCATCHVVVPDDWTCLLYTSDAADEVSPV